MCGNTKTPPVLSDRGRKIRGTTSDSPIPHGIDLTASNNAIRCFGRTRPSLLGFQEGHSGRYFSELPHCLAPTGSSLAERFSPTYSHQCVAYMVANFMRFVKVFLYGAPSISAALSSVISVIFAPPMIRANSRLRPSKSRGVTVV